MLDHPAPPSAAVALHLYLLIHAGREHVLDNANSATSASIAFVNIFLRARTRTFTVFANSFPLDLYFVRLASVHVSEIDFHIHDHVRALANALLLLVAVSAKEGSKNIERVVEPVPSSLPLLRMLLQSILKPSKQVSERVQIISNERDNT